MFAIAICSFHSRELALLWCIYAMCNKKLASGLLETLAIITNFINGGSIFKNPLLRAAFSMYADVFHIHLPLSFDSESYRALKTPCVIVSNYPDTVCGYMVFRIFRNVRLFMKPVAISKLLSRFFSKDDGIIVLKNGGKQFDKAESECACAFKEGASIFGFVAGTKKERVKTGLFRIAARAGIPVLRIRLQDDFTDHIIRLYLDEPHLIQNDERSIRLFAINTAKFMFGRTTRDGKKVHSESEQPGKMAVLPIGYTLK